jgi:hypothetical protein
MEESLSRRRGMVGLEGSGIDFWLKICTRSDLAVSEARFGRSCSRVEFKAGMKSISGNESDPKSGKWSYRQR